MSSLWINNPRKKPDPPEMMDGTDKISSPASPPGGKRLDPPEMMNGCCRIPSHAQDTTVDHNLLGQSIPDISRSAHDTLSLRGVYYYLNRKTPELEGNTVALSMTFPLNFSGPIVTEETLLTSSKDLCGSRQQEDNSVGSSSCERPMAPPDTSIRLRTLPSDKESERHHDSMLGDDECSDEESEYRHVSMLGDDECSDEESEEYRHESTSGDEECSEEESEYRHDDSILEVEECSVPPAAANGLSETAPDALLSRKREAEPRNSVGKRAKEILHSQPSFDSIKSVMDSQQAASPANGMTLDAIRCVPLQEPIPSSVRERTENAPLPSRKQLLNYPQYCYELTRNGKRRCIMCGLLRLVVRKRGEETALPVILRSNRGICTACEVTVWKLLESDLVIKWCHGPCKKFCPLAAFGDKRTFKCCDWCRYRSRKYASAGNMQTAVRKGEHPAKQWQPVGTTPPICQICGKGESPQKQLCYFLPTAFEPEPTVLHVFCGKSAAILSIDRPDLEILSKSGIKNKHGNGPGVLVALQRSRTVTVVEKNQREQIYYLVKEVEGHLNHSKYQRDNREYLSQRSVHYPSEVLKPTAVLLPQQAIQNLPVDPSTEEHKPSNDVITPASIHDACATMNPPPQDCNPHYTTNKAYYISPPVGYSLVRPVSRRGRLRRRGF